PGAIGFIYSFTDYTGIGSADFVGLDNYTTLFADGSFYQALIRTFLYAVMAVPLTYVLSLAIASLLVSRFAKGTSVARVIFFIPWLISPIVTGVIWRWMFGENFGLVNFLVQSFGGNAVQWQSNANLSLIVGVFAASWMGIALH